MVPVSAAAPRLATNALSLRSARMQAPSMALKSPRRSSGSRTLANRMSSTSSARTPLWATRTAGIRTPSWKISVAVPDRLPGTMPPMSCQCAMTPTSASGTPSANTGFTSATSFRCVPPA